MAPGPPGAEEARAARTGLVLQTWGEAQDAVDLGGRERPVGLVGGDDQVGGEVHLAEEVAILQRQAELILHRLPPGCIGPRHLPPPTTVCPQQAAPNPPWSAGHAHPDNPPACKQAFRRDPPRPRFEISAPCPVAARSVVGDRLSQGRAHAGASPPGDGQLGCYQGEPGSFQHAFNVSAAAGWWEGRR